MITTFFHSLIAFLVAFLIMCFDGTQEAVHLIVGIPSAVIALVMVFCIYTMRSNDEERSAGPFLVKYHQKLRSFYDRYFPQFWGRRVDSDSAELQALPQPQAPSITQISHV